MKHSGLPCSDLRFDLLQQLWLLHDMFQNATIFSRVPPQRISNFSEAEGVDYTLRPKL